MCKRTIQIQITRIRGLSEYPQIFYSDSASASVQLVFVRLTCDWQTFWSFEPVLYIDMIVPMAWYHFLFILFSDFNDRARAAVWHERRKQPAITTSPVSHTSAISAIWVTAAWGMSDRTTRQKNTVSLTFFRKKRKSDKKITHIALLYSTIC